MDQLAPEGPVYQAGTLSGNPLALAAGIASVQKLKEENPYPILEKLGQQVQLAMIETAQAKGIPLQVPQVGSMFALFFNENAVNNYREAKASDTELFARFFQRALEHGVYYHFRLRNLLHLNRPRKQQH